MTVAEFLYTTVFKHRHVKRLVNAGILAILPESIRYGNLRIMLNPRDPVARAGASRSLAHICGSFSLP